MSYLTALKAGPSVLLKAQQQGQNGVAYINPDITKARLSHSSALSEMES